jgi:hypothetical protein
MAASTSFRQTCPSCEERVLIKDAKLVGKKIDCPKCKYRFAVEAPKEEEPAEGQESAEAAPATKKIGKATVKAAAPPAKGEGKTTTKAEARADTKTDTKADAKTETNGKSAPAKKKPAKKGKDGEEDDEDEKKTFKKKSDKGSKKILAISGLVGFAVILLGVAAYFVFFTGDSKKPNKKGTGLDFGKTGTSNTGTGGGDDDKPVGDTKPKPKGFELAEASNHLPPETESVTNIKVKDFLASPLGKTLFDPAGGLPADVVKHKSGIGVDEIDRILIAESEKADWVFVVVRTSAGVKIDTLSSWLQLKKSGSPVGGREYFISESNWRESLPRQLAALMVKKKAEPGARPLAVHQFDSQTIVLGDVEPMKQFLEYQGKPPAQDDSGIPAARGGPAPPRPPPMGPMGPMGPAGAAGPARPAASDVPYSTISPRLKGVLDRLEMKTQEGKYKLLVSTARAVPPSAQNMIKLIPGMDAVVCPRAGLVLTNEGGLGATVLVECKSAEDAKKLDELVKKGLELLPPLIEAREKIAVELKKVDPNRPAPYGPMNPNTRPVVPVGPMGPMGPMGVNPNPAGDEKKPTANDPMLTLEGPKTTGAMVQVSAILNVPAYQVLNLKYLSPSLHHFRGEMELAQKQPTPHDLAGALRTLAAKNKAYPLAAVERPTLAARGARPWHPNQRVSFFADLLPLLGYEDLHREINKEKSWNEGDNLNVAMTLVPYFVVPEYAPQYRYVQPAGMDTLVGAAHYVGIAGVGYEAASYEPGGPDAAKMGVFGYDRKTPLADVSAHTIVMIQVPPPYVGPWMAGGGATVRGVPEKNSIKPFVSTTYNKKPGTFAMMGDGSVRFIGADIADEVFKALAVVNKNPPPEEFDQKCPKVPRQAQLRAGAR